MGSSTAAVEESMKSPLGRFFFKFSRVPLWNPCVTIWASVFVVALAALGLLRLEIVSNPQKIWVPPGSDTALQQHFFDQGFNPFFRTEVSIFTRQGYESMSAHDSDMLKVDYLSAILELQNKITNDVDPNTGLKLDDLCFKPIEGQGCIIESPLNYWHSNMTIVKSLNPQAIQDTIACKPGAAGLQVPCVSSIGVPIMKKVILGGLTENCSAGTQLCGGCNTVANSLIMTFLLNSHGDGGDSDNANAESWEKNVFLKNVEAFNHGDLAVSYMASRSIADELLIVDSQNQYVVIVSYVAMFAYITLALGKFPHPVKTRAALGFQGIGIVSASVAAGIGIVSACGVPLTMIVTVVVPFLILAIGVDNMFIITKAYDTRAEHVPDETTSERMSWTLAEVGPSITGAAFSECLAFGVGAFTDIPALKGFCLVATIAVLMDYVLQITWFVAAVVWDADRQADRRADVLCCFRVRHERASKGTFWTFVNEGKYVKRAITKWYAPCLMMSVSKAIVLVAWMGMLVGSFYASTQLKLGLDQQLVLPVGSYLTPFFDQQEELMESGAPLYVILQNVNYTHPDTLDAFDDITSGLAQLPEYVELPISSWYQAFEGYDKEGCGGTQCLSVCPAQNKNQTYARRVYDYLQIEIDSQCCQDYGVCGAQYQQDVEFFWDTTTAKDGVAQTSDGRWWKPLYVLTSRMRGLHTPARVQADYINQMEHVQSVIRQLGKAIPQIDLDLIDLPAVRPEQPKHENFTQIVHTEWIDVAPGGPAFAYSLFYVYYAQYSYIRGIAVQNLLLATGAVFVAAMFFTSPGTALPVALCVACTAIDIVGFVWLMNPDVIDHDEKYGVDINAVSVVNLVAAVGLAVEFMVHIAARFASLQGSRTQRAKQALIEMGSSVVTGITITKFVGITVLLAAPSQLFRLYYFRMYMGIIVLGAFHGLAFLPVMLSLVGPAAPHKAYCEDDGDINKALLDKASAKADDYGGIGEAE